MRKFVALFVAVVFALASGPAAVAIPATPQHTMTMHGTMQDMHVASHDMVPCKHCPHGMDRQQPCKGMLQCQMMLNCSGIMALAYPGVAHAPRSLSWGLVWERHDTGPGIILGPDHPPPIA